MIIFDVGAHDGKDSIRLLNKFTRRRYYGKGNQRPVHKTNINFNFSEQDKVYAFEPTPYLVDRFLKVFERGLPGVFIPIQKAVSDIEGTLMFNVASKKPGCSSLNEFSDNLNETWPEVRDFKVTDQIEVETIRLDNFIKENRIEQIDHFHCDVQGNDLKVLKSLGDDIEKVVSGRVEAYNYSPLYKNTDNSVPLIIEYLESKGMRVKSRHLLLKQGHKDVMLDNYQGHKFKEVNIKFFGPRYTRPIS